MKIVAFQKQSLIEYPEKISAIIFLAGCNFRCPFCYLPFLVLPPKIQKQKKIPEKIIFSFLRERKKFLEAVTITGGEPTIHSQLPNFIRKIKKMDYLVGLETNGSNPKMLKYLIEKGLVNYVAMDIKHDLIFEKWYNITGQVLTKKLFENIKQSIKILLEGKIDYEFRTTLLKDFHRPEDIIGICKKISGAKVYYLQNYEKTEGETVSQRDFTPFSKEEILKIVEEGRKYANVKVRPYLL